MFGLSRKVKAPSPLLVMLEGRALFELGAMALSTPFLKRLPRGDGHPVLVLPGLGASGSSTKPLRNFLKDRGYTPYCWGQGRNLGLRGNLLEDMLTRIDEVYAMHQQKISLIGWSLGGIFAREIAKLRPEQTRLVISLGSPHSGNPKNSNAWRFYEFAAGHSVEEPPIETMMHKAPPVPTTSIYTKTDGIVAWQNCHQERPVCEKKQKHTENIRVEGSHCGLGFNPMVLYVIADRLAQREGNWRPFANVGSRKVFYDTPGFEAAAPA